MHREGLVSVIMSVYNGEKYLEQAVRSILKQTYDHFEFIIVNDCSTDTTGDVLYQLSSDKRVRIITNETNLGLAASLKKGMEVAEGEFIARMDADDIALPDRFSMQIAFLKNNQHVDIIGSWKKSFGASSYVSKYPVGVEECKATVLFGVPVGHPCVMMRHQSLREKGLAYNLQLREGEDYDLWFNAWDKGLNFSNIPKVLLKYRTFPDSGKKSIRKVRHAESCKIRKRALECFGINFSQQELDLHNYISTQWYTDNKVSFSEVEQWFLKMKDYNEKKRVIEPTMFNKVLAQQFFEFCYHQEQSMGRSHFMNSIFRLYYTPSVNISAKWIIKSFGNHIFK